MLHLSDHAAYRRRIFKHAAAVALVQTEPFEGGLLIAAASDRAADLLDGQRLFGVHQAGSRGASVSRRPRISPTRLPRNAANVALIILCGLALPTDLATTSWTPRASKIARIGPPAMIPVPGLAAR